MFSKETRITITKIAMTLSAVGFFISVFKGDAETAVVNALAFAFNAHMHKMVKELK